MGRRRRTHSSPSSVGARTLSLNNRSCVQTPGRPAGLVRPECFRHICGFRPSTARRRQADRLTLDFFSRKKTRRRHSSVRAVVSKSYKKAVAAGAEVTPARYRGCHLASRRVVSLRFTVTRTRTKIVDTSSGVVTAL